ncbi:MAG: SpoIIE family protein phosphatase [Phycisphaerae bacterium]|nr:SpoIIE family protein phosphatase [Phycisphaerae bacterium]
MKLPQAQNTWDNNDDSKKTLTRIQIFCPQPRLPEHLRPMLNRKDVQCSWVMTYQALETHALMDQFDLVVFVPGPITDVEQKRRIGKLLQTAQQKLMPIILVSKDPSLANLIPIQDDQVLPRVQMADPDISVEELWGRIFAMLNYSPLFNRIERHMKHLEKWADNLNSRFEELHQELRLAWRVQQDFLPKKLPHTSKFRFAALYRPAAWVSGDIYDIFQIDEKHIGFNIADVVGHGVAAGLMTLFVKRALITKEILEKSYHILPPNQALARLNEDICSLELPEHQFVTAAYGMIDIQTGELTLARGGHPHPLKFDADGQLSLIETEGALLGAFKDVNFGIHHSTLHAGEKLVLYTDGLEQAFGEGSDEQKMIEQVSALSVNKSAQEMVDSLSSLLDCQENSLTPADDITVVVVEAIPD